MRLLTEQCHSSKTTGLLPIGYFPWSLLSTSPQNSHPALLQLQTWKRYARFSKTYLYPQRFTILSSQFYEAIAVLVEFLIDSTNSQFTP